MSSSPMVFTNCLSPAINQGLQHPEEIQRRVQNESHGDVDFEIACSECQEHEDSMRRAGATVCNLQVNHDLPDGVFVQDTAYVLQCRHTGQWHAFGANMGHPSRQPEVSAVLQRLAEHEMQIHSFPEDNDGRIEFGDVFAPMALGEDRVVFIGRREIDSRVACRTDDSGASWFRQHVVELGYLPVEFEFRETLHSTSLGNAVGTTPIDKPLALVDGSRCSLSEFKRFGVDVPQLEETLRKKYAWGLNTVRLNGSVVMQRGFDPVRELLTNYGFQQQQIIDTPWTQLPRRDGSPSCRCILKVPSI